MTPSPKHISTNNNNNKTTINSRTETTTDTDDNNNTTDDSYGLPIQLVVIDTSAWIDIDLYGINTLMDIHAELLTANVSLAFANCNSIVRDKLIKNLSFLNIPSATATEPTSIEIPTANEYIFNSIDEAIRKLDKNKNIRKIEQARLINAIEAKSSGKKKLLHTSNNINNTSSNKNLTTNRNNIKMKRAYSDQHFYSNNNNNNNNRDIDIINNHRVHRKSSSNSIDHPHPHPLYNIYDAANNNNSLNNTNSSSENYNDPPEVNIDDNDKNSLQQTLLHRHTSNTNINNERCLNNHFDADVEDNDTDYIFDSVNRRKQVLLGYASSPFYPRSPSPSASLAHSQYLGYIPSHNNHNTSSSSNNNINNLNTIGHLATVHVVTTTDDDNNMNISATDRLLLHEPLSEEDEEIVKGFKKDDSSHHSRLKILTAMSDRNIWTYEI